MRALVLAAGRGERLRALAGDMPKPMARIEGMPVLEHVIEHLRRSGIRDIIVNLHHLPDAIRNYFGDGEKWGVSIGYSFEPELLGTAGAAKKLQDEFHETFLVYYGDNLCDCDLRRLERFHRRRGGAATIVVAESYDDVAGGVVEFGSDGLLEKFSEKPVSPGPGARWENGGIYILEPGVHSFIPQGRPSDFARDVFPALLKAGEKIYCYRSEGPIRGIDTPERFWLVRGELARGRLKLR